MTKVYQTIIDKEKGNCMQAAFASLFELPLEQVPHFLEFGSTWYEELHQFLKRLGYEHTYTIRNNSYYNNGSKDRFNEIKDSPGINGYFFASVCSPKFYTDTEHITHAVIIDKEFNIVHDVNPNNINVTYPLADKIGYNGIINIWMMEPISNI